MTPELHWTAYFSTLLTPTVGLEAVARERTILTSQEVR